MRSDSAMLKEKTKTRATSHVGRLNVQFTSANRKRLLKKNPLLSKMNMTAQLRFTKLHLNKP